MGWTLPAGPLVDEKLVGVELPKAGDVQIQPGVVVDVEKRASPSDSVAGDTRIGGKIPLNTSGGLKSKGHPVGASGVAQAVEIVKQLRGEADKRQVKGAKVGMTQNMGGTGASSVVHVMEVM